jgi:hypothetical protein
MRRAGGFAPGRNVAKEFVVPPFGTFFDRRAIILEG